MFEKYESMLKLIGFSEMDELYIIGDVIDRGIDGVKILQDIMKRRNVHVIMGNHELMAVETLLAEDLDTQLEKMDLWECNGGACTYESLMNLSGQEREKIVDFMMDLPEYAEIEVNGHKFYFVHGYPAETVREQVWSRPNLSTPNPYSDGTLIIGHTPVMLLHDDTDHACKDEHFKIEHTEGFIDIDCGCGHNVAGACLGCLRLDDMNEFYT
jgi:serine/threonine protein phosphatase 1